MMSMSVLTLFLVLEEILLVFLTQYDAGSWFLTDTLSWIDICSFYFLPSGIFITREFWNLLKALPESIVITLPLISYGLWTYYCMFIINIIDLLVLNHSCIPEIRPFFPFLKILVEFFFFKNSVENFLASILIGAIVIGDLWCLCSFLPVVSGWLLVSQN